MEMFLRKYTPTCLEGTHLTNAVAGVLQPLFIGDKLSFAKKYLAFRFLFCVEKGKRLGG